MSCCIIGDNILSSLGITTEENILAIRQGKSGVRQFADFAGVGDPYAASVVEDSQLDFFYNALQLPFNRFTRFERMMLVSVVLASVNNRSLLSNKRTLFVFSTTKGNVELLDSSMTDCKENDNVLLWQSAQKIATYFGNPNQPVVVSNACISGVVAQIVAKRFISTGKYDTAVVVGADVLSRFIISGFASFKALSPNRCKPFDANRCGLNIGEGAGTIIYQDIEDSDSEGYVQLAAGAITNDANHISGPSRTGEGLYLALEQILESDHRDRVRFISAHGTATPYNDEMEAIAINRAGCQEIPLFSLKAYIGHTMGASGVIETIIAAHALKDGLIPQSLGFEHLGVSQKVNVTTQPMAFEPKGECIKTISGFGGCNATIRMKL